MPQPKGISRLLSRVYKKIEKQIASEAKSHGRIFAGVAREGYNGGYLSALEDVQLALNGVKPNRNGWWDEDPESGS